MYGLQCVFHSMCAQIYFRAVHVLSFSTALLCIQLSSKRFVNILLGILYNISTRILYIHMVYMYV